MGIYDTINNLPSVDDVIASARAAPPPEDTSTNPFLAGIAKGYLGLSAGLASTISGGAKLVGADGVSNYFGQNAKDIAATAASYRPDLDRAGWLDSPGTFLSKGAQALGGFVPYAALTEVSGGASDILGVTRALSPLAKYLPGALGGVAADAGAAATSKAARAIGGFSLLNYPTAVGSQLDEANKQPGGASSGDILRAFAQGVPLSVAQSIVPGGTVGQVADMASHVAGQTAIRVGKSAFSNAAAGAVGSGLQAAANTSFDPNMSVSDRASAIVGAAAQGAAMGGFLGGITGFLPHVDPQATSTDTLKAQTDKLMDQLGGTQPPDMPAPPMPPAPVPMTPELGGGALPPDAVPQSAFPTTMNMRQMQMDLRTQFADLPPGAEPGFDGLPPADLGTAPPQPGAPKIDELRYNAALAASRDQTVNANAPVTEATPAGALPDDIEAALRDMSDPAKPDAGARLNAILNRVTPPEQGDRTPIGDPPNLFDIAQRDAQKVGPPAPLPDFAEAPTSAVRGLADFTAAQSKIKNDLFASLGDTDRNIASSGKMRDFINASDATSPGALWNEMTDAIAAKDPVTKSAGFKKIAQSLGLFDQSNKLRDLDAEADAHQQAGTPLPDDLQSAMAARDEAAQLAEKVGPTQPETRAPNAETDPDMAAYMEGPRHSDLSISEITQMQARRLAEVQAENAAARPDAPPTAANDIPTSRQLAQQEEADARQRDLQRVQSMVGPREPQPVVDQVRDAAREIGGDTGNGVSIEAIRDKLSDKIARPDIDAALQQIHADSTADHLAPAPKGQRNGADGKPYGIKVDGQGGLLHHLVLEPRGDAEERSATTEAAGDQPGSTEAARGADASGDRTPGEGGAAAEEGATQGQPGAADVPFTPRRAGQSIGSHVAEALVRAGRPENEARLAGALEQHHYEARAERFKGKLGTAQELYDRDGAAIQRGEIPASHEASIYNQMDLDGMKKLIADAKAQAAKPKPKFSDKPISTAITGRTRSDRLLNLNDPGVVKDVHWPDYNPDRDKSVNTILSKKMPPLAFAEEAKARGFNPNVNLFKGMIGAFRGKGFDDPITKPHEKALFFGDHPIVSNAYTGLGGGRPGSNVVPLIARPKKVGVVDYQHYTQGEPGYMNEAMRRIINHGHENGYDMMVIHNMQDSVEGHGPYGSPPDQTQYAVLKNNILRARHAAFEASKEGSNDILSQANRGSIKLTPGERPVISLMKNADASTFIHELGHKWLNELSIDAVHPDAPEGLKADFQTVRKYLGAKTGEFTEAQHEKFARAMENYVRSGKAPSSRLAEVFSQFRDWLTGIYKTAREMRAPMSDDIRGVFDRLVGTDRSPVEAAMDQEHGINQGTVDPTQRPFEDTTNPAAYRQDASGTQPEPIKTPSGTQLPRDAIGATPRQALDTNTPPEPLRKAVPQPKALTGSTVDPVGTPAMPLEDARSHFDQVVQNFSPALRDKVHFLEGPEDVPIDVRANASTFDPDSALGYFHDGQVYVRGDNITSPAALEEVLSHEVIGHMANLIRSGGDGDVLEKAMTSIYNAAGGDAGIEKIARRLKVWEDREGSPISGLKGYMDTDNATKIDELLSLATSSPIPRVQRAALSFVGNMKAAIANIMDRVGLKEFAQKVMGFGASDVIKWVDDNKAMLEAHKPSQPDKVDLSTILAGRAGARVSAARPATMDAINENASRAGRATTAIMAALDKLPRLEASRLPGAVFNYLRSSQGMAREWARDLTALPAHYAERQMRKSIEDHENGVRNAHNQEAADFIRRFPKAGENLQKLEAITTEMNVDAFRKWEEHTWWSADHPNYDNAKAAHAEAVSLKNKLGQASKEGAPAGRALELYAKDVALGKGDNYAQMAMLLQYQHDQGKLSIPGFENNPAKDFVNNRADLHEDIAGRSDYWKGELQKRMTAVGNYIRQTEGKNAEVRNAIVKQKLDDARAEAAQSGKKFDQRKFMASLGPIRDERLVDVSTMKDLYNAHNDAISKMAEAPYFRLDRKGDQFYSFHVAKDEDGNLRPDAVSNIQQALRENGFGGYSLNALNDNAHVYMRLPNLDTAQRLHETLQRLSPDNFDTTQDFTKGPLTSENTPRDIPMLDTMMSKLAEQYTNYPPEVASKLLADARSMLVSALPDNSIRSALEHRDNVQGYSMDMLNANVHRGQMTARSISDLATRTTLADLEAKMKAVVADAKVSKSPKEATALNDKLQAYMAQMSAGALRPPNKYADMARVATHTYYIGASPGYVVLNMSQLPTLTVPSFMRNHSFARTLPAMMGALGDTGKVISALVKAKTTTLTPEILKASGLSQEKIDHLQMMSNSGHIETGTFAKSLDPNQNEILRRAGKALRAANATAVLSETAGRIITALAAKKLYDEIPAGAQRDALHARYPDAASYSRRMVSDSQMDWGSMNTPRLFSRGGPLGQMGPVIGQFHTFGTKLAELIYGTMHTALTDRAATPQEKLEARRFLASHSAAVIALSGTLGLPAAGWVAALATKLSAPFNGGQAYDVEAHYRDFLAHIFGKSVGEGLAKGFTRPLLNADMSDLGDKDLLPMTRLLEDRRQLSEAMPAYLSSMWGSSIGAGMNVVAGMNDLANGRPMVAFSRMLPTGFKNLARAYKLSKTGYTDSQGRRMDIPVGATNIIQQALGINNAGYEQEEERSRSVQGAMEDRRYRSAVIKQNLAVARETGDQEGVQKWMQAAHQFDRDPQNRGMPIGPTIESYLEARQRAMALQRRTGGPLNLTIKDRPDAATVDYGGR